MRTAAGIEALLQPLEEAIRHQFLPAMSGRQGISDLERDLLALPARHGGLGIQIQTRNAINQFKACRKVTANLVNLILQWNPTYPMSLQQEQRHMKIALHTRKRRETANEAELLKPKLSGARQRTLEQASKKGAFAWLTAIPMSKHGFN